MFDANTVVSAALTQDGQSRRAIVTARNRGLIALSEPVYTEIAEVLARPKFRWALSEGRRLEILELLTAGALWVETTQTVSDCRDAKDNRYLELALEAGAAFIVSGDGDLLTLNPWRGIAVLRPSAFVRAMETS